MNIIVGVTGSISAYKALDIVSGFRKEGHNVKVIMTEFSKMFVTEMSLAVISANPVITKFGSEGLHVVEHVDLANWADIMVIAPATANTISKMASIQLDNPLLCTYSVFAGKKKESWNKIYIAPAMNTHMLNMVNPLMTKLVCSNPRIKIIQSDKGMLVCGEEGDGKLRNVSDIIQTVCRSGL